MQKKKIDFYFVGIVTMQKTDTTVPTANMQLRIFVVKDWQMPVAQKGCRKSLNNNEIFKISSHFISFLNVQSILNSQI